MNNYPKSQRSLDRQLAREANDWWRDVLITLCLCIVLALLATFLHWHVSHKLAQAETMPLLYVDMYMPLIVIDCVPVRFVRPPFTPSPDCAKGN